MPASELRSLAHLFKRPPKLTVSEWADRYRILRSDFAAEPGPWRTDRIPYVREIQDSFTDRNVDRITFLKSAQVGGTEVMNNCALYAMDGDPGPALYVLPTDEMAEEEIAGRLRSMVEDCPQVARHIVDKKRWQTSSRIKLATMRLYMGYAKSPQTLTRRAIKYIFFDELDNCAQMAGSLGNHLTLAAERATTFGYRSMAMSVTTPTHPEAPANMEWEESDKRRYFVPCPLCGAYQVLRLAQIRCPDEISEPAEIEASGCAYYVCEDCDGHIPQSQKTWMVDCGVWVPEALSIVEKLPIDDAAIVTLASLPGKDRWTPEIEGEKPKTRRIGFHIWSAYSPWRSWSKILAEFFRVKKDPERFRVFINSWLGEVWKEAAEETTYESFAAKRDGALPLGTVPDEVLIIVAGADVQKDHIYYVLRGWGYHGRSFLIAHGVVPTMEDFYDICRQPYRTESGTQTSVTYAAIDSGSRTGEVYEFVERHQGVYPIKGQPSQALPVRESDIKYERPGKKRIRTRLLHVDGGHFKEILYRLVKLENNAAGAFQICADASDEYCRQFTAEQLVWIRKKVRGGTKRVREWRTRTETTPNHYLDAEVYAAAIAYHKGVMRLRPPEPETAPPPTKRPRREQLGKGPMNWKSRQATRR